MKLTNYSTSGGCGCKVSIKTLELILSQLSVTHKNELISSFINFDDAAIYEISESKYLIYSVDFFTPIVNDAFCFGKIAACNSISDILVYGGKPLLALSILGFPKDIELTDVPSRILKGAEEIAKELDFKIVGGHTIYNPQIIYGLSVIGITEYKPKLNNSAKANDLLYLTKPLGSGILSTALKKELILEKDEMELIKVLETPNMFGIILANLEYVNCVTDVTGYGLIGHLGNICKSSNVSAYLNFDKIKLLASVTYYIDKGIQTNGGLNNWEMYKNNVCIEDNLKRIILCDPQTNGGLLVAIDPLKKEAFEYLLKENNLAEYSEPIGYLAETKNDIIYVK